MDNCTTIENVTKHQFHFPGIYTSEEHIDSHEIVYPRKVTSQGDLISYNVTHHHHEENNDSHAVYYRLAIEGREYHLELESISNFISPAMVVERRKRAVHQRASSKHRCHYRGIIRDQPDSRVVLSACDGLVSFNF